MRIPLDYYRILGLPIQASAEQLQQAYRDRLLQLPRREYSEKAIAARKQILEAAYAVLVDPKQRSRYDSNYFSTYSEPETDSETVAVETLTPSIEITDEQFVGALSILQELGEYELVLNLSNPYLHSESAQSTDPDIVLSVALACLELGREQWQQGQYEKAAYSLEQGYNLLLNAQLFPSVSSEIQADLSKLRPYRILELLAQPEDNLAERRQGLRLLQEMLEARGGIDGTGEDGSGLALDDFLRFIQQLRSYLNSREQQDLFEAESQRPSAVANYLAVYAAIARGFAERMPVFIRKAKLHLMRLGKRQDVHLEQAVCSLLLGQTAEASRALELSQEYETLAFIQQNSQGAPDLLPGLCLYSERWLQNEVFVQFRDLANEQVSLKDYFADEQVQAYLEALPTEVEATNEWDAVAVAPPTYTQVSSSSEPSQTRASNSQENSQGSTTTTRTPGGAIALADRNTNNSTLVAIEPSGRTKKRQRRFRSSGAGTKQIRLILLALTGLFGVLFLGFLATRTYAWLQHSLNPAPLLEGEQPVVQLNEPLFTDASLKAPLAADSLLTKESAQEVIQEWLLTKALAFSSRHQADELKQILVEPALSQWQQRVESDRISNRYRQFKHELTIDTVETDAAKRDRAQVIATVNEVAQVYAGDRLDEDMSYDEKLQVRYNLVRQNNQWRIEEMAVIR